MSWTEKAGTVDFQTPKYKWTQTIDDVIVTIPVPEGTTAKQIDYVIKQNYLKLGIKGQPPILEGELFGTVIPKECTWTLEDKKQIYLVLSKALKHESWRSVIKGEYEIDPFTKDQMDRKMMLEKFQRENPGFDFSGAEFTGQLPPDPKNFGFFPDKQ